MSTSHRDNGFRHDVIWRKVARCRGNTVCFRSLCPPTDVGVGVVADVVVDNVAVKHTFHLFLCSFK